MIACSNVHALHNFLAQKNMLHPVKRVLGENIPQLSRLMKLKQEGKRDEFMSAVADLKTMHIRFVGKSFPIAIGNRK